MEAFVVEGGVALRGEARVDSAKNAVLPILAAAVLTPEEIVLHNVPDITDVGHMAAILTMLGCLVERSGRDMTVDCGGIHSWEMPDQLSKQIRSSIFLLGPILARFRKATVTFPGGCEIGLRPIDLHLSGLRQLGVEISEEGGLIHCDGRNMHAGEVHFDYPSVGATENILLAAVLAQGVTRIENAAKEPEIVDLCALLSRMGAKIRGCGTSTLYIEGVRELHGCVYRPIPDRIEAGTLCCAVGMTQGSVFLRNIRPDHMRAVLYKLREAGMDFRESQAGLRISGRAKNPIQVRTLTYPGFPTDMQAPMMALALCSRGASVFCETIFENRFMHARELARLGARIRIEDRIALVEGGYPLQGAAVTSTDLRGGAALMLAGLLAQGETLLSDPHGHIARGYENLPGMLRELGADIEEATEDGWSSANG